MKVIHIKTVPSKINYLTIDQSNWEINKEGNKINPNNLESNHFASWALNFAIKTREKNPDYEIEIWQIYDTNDFGDCGVSIMEEYNMTSILFPSYKYLNQSVSLSLLNELRERIASDEKILIHLQSIHRFFDYLISRECKTVPLVCSQRSTSPPSFKMIEYMGKKSTIINKFHGLFLQFLDLIYSNNIDHVFATSIGEYNYIKSHESNKVSFVRGGGWFPEEYPQSSKNQLRKELNLPLNKKIMIHVGRLDPWRGYENAIELYTKLKSQGFELIIAGAQKSDLGYEKVAISGAIFIEYLPRPELMKYIRASDIFLCLSNIKSTIIFSGLGSSIMEASNLGVPILSTTLVSFQGSKEERRQLGLIPKVPIDIENAEKCVKYIIKNPNRFSKGKEVAKKYYSWDSIMRVHLNIYKDLINKYYV